MLNLTNHQTHKMPTLALLMLTLGFSLSSGTGAQASKIMSRDLASQSNCDIARQLDEGNNSAECIVEQVIDGEKVTGRMTVNVVMGKPKPIRDKNDPTIVTFGEAEKVLEIRTEASFACASGGCDPLAGSPRHEPIQKLSTDTDGIAALAKRDFQAIAREAAQKAKENKRKQEKIDLCLEEADGTKIASGAVQLDCRLQKMRDMGTDEAAQYWEANIKGEIHNLLKSCEAPGVKPVGTGAVAMSANCARDAKLAAQLLQNAKAYSEDKPFVKASVEELAGYGTYLTGVKQLESQIAMSANNPQQRAQLMQQLQALKTNWGTYYQNQGLLSQNNLELISHDYQTSLMNDLQAYQAQLDQTYASILGNAGINNANGAGRMGRGDGFVPSNPWANSGVTGGNRLPTIPSTGQQVTPPNALQPGMGGLPQMPGNLPSKPSVPGSARIPMPGTPVR